MGEQRGTAVSGGDDGQDAAGGGLVSGLISTCTERFRGRVAGEVLRGHTQLSPEALGRLKSAIDACVKAPGFRKGHASQGLGPGLTTALRNHLGFGYPPLAPAVLQAWLELKGAVLEEARRLLEEGGFEILDPSPYPDFAGDGGYSEVFKWVRERLSGRPEDELDDLLLAAWALTQWGRPYEGLGDRNEAGARGENGNVDDDADGDENDRLASAGAHERVPPTDATPGLLAPFRELPSEDGFWDSVDDFVIALHSLREERLSERSRSRRQAETEAQRERLGQTLRQLEEEHRDTLSYFGLPWPDFEAVVGLDEEKVPRAIERLSELGNVLREAAETRVSMPPTRVEEARRQKALEALHGRLSGLLGQLEGDLGVATGGAPETATEAGDMTSAAATPTEPEATVVPPIEPSAEPAPVPTPSLLPEPVDAEGAGGTLPSDADAAVVGSPVNRPAEVPDEGPPTVSEQTAAKGTNALQVETLSEESLTDALGRAVRDGRMPLPVGLAEEAQLRWLSRGLNLRAWILASWAEVGTPGVDVSVPSWLCWFAVNFADEGAMGLTLPPEAYVNQLLSQSWEDGRLSRFLVGWLSYGLLGDNVAKAMEVSAYLPEGFGEDVAFPAEGGLDFLVSRVIGPARRGQRALTRVVTSRADLESRIRTALADAEGRRQLSDKQFKNGGVKKFWCALSAPSGPMTTLWERVKRGATVEIPTASSLAAKVEGEDEIIGKYRNAIDHRLEEFLRALRVAASAIAELQRLDQPATDLVTPDDLRRAAESLRAAIPRLEGERCPSVEAFRRLAVRLTERSNPGGER